MKGDVGVDEVKLNTWQHIRKNIMYADIGTVFVLSDFADYGDYETVKKALQKLCEEGIIRRALPGVYYRPTFSSILRQEVPPKIEAVAEAIARNNNWTIIPEGEKGLNMLGLSTQVPAHTIFITNGPSKSYEVGKQKFEFRHVQPKNIVGLSAKTALVVEALRNLGEQNIDDSIVTRLQSIYTPEEKQQLMLETKKVTRWIRSIMAQVVQDKGLSNV